MSLEYRLQMRETEKLAELLEQAGKKAPPSLRVAIRSSLVFIVRFIAKRKLLGQVLNRVTGTLIRNVTASPRITRYDERGVAGTLGTSLDYGRAHEEGFHGTVQVRAHTRRLAYARTKRERAKKLKAALQEGRKTVAYVRAHSRRMDIRARRYIASSVRTARPSVDHRLQRALTIAIWENRVPRAKDLAPAAGALTFGRGPA